MYKIWICAGHGATAYGMKENDNTLVMSKACKK